jgi:hypothetical protein
LLPHLTCVEALLSNIREDGRSYTPQGTEVTDGGHVHRSLPGSSANTLSRNFRHTVPIHKVISVIGRLILIELMW